MSGFSFDADQTAHTTVNYSQSVYSICSTSKPQCRFGYVSTRQPSRLPTRANDHSTLNPSGSKNTFRKYVISCAPCWVLQRRSASGALDLQASQLFVRHELLSAAAADFDSRQHSRGSLGSRNGDWTGSEPKSKRQDFKGALTVDRSEWFRTHAGWCQC